MKTFALSLLVAGSLLAQGNTKPKPAAAPQASALAWEHDLPGAMKRAKAERKLIFMDVWTEWCGWCIKLQKDTFPTPAAQAALAKVVPLSLKTQLRKGEPTEHKFVEAQYGVDAYPMLIILDADGKEVARQAGFLAPAAFADWINGVVASAKK